MKIESVRLFRYDLPLREGLRFRGPSPDVRSGVLIEVASGGAAGWGDIAPLPGFSAEGLDEAAGGAASLRGRLLSFDLDPELPSAAWEDLLRGLPPSVRSGCEQACLGLLAGAGGTTLRGLLADGASDRIHICALLAGTPAQVLEGAAAAARAGHRCAKLKVGRTDVEADIALAREVRRILGESVALRIDANRAWSLGEAIGFVRGVGGPIEYIEEPVKDPIDLPAFAAATGAPVALDETLADARCPDWTGIPGVKAVVLKPTILGGILRCRRIALRAAERGQRAVVSSSFESGVGLLGLCEAAAALGGEGVAAGLDTGRWLARDVLDPPLRLGPVVDLPALPRPGAVLDAAALRELPHD